MKSMTPSVRVLIALELCLGFQATSFAEHPHGAAKHRPKVVISLFTPQGRPVIQHHDRYRYVIPSTPRHGAYYAYENKYYYTPPGSHGGPQHLQPVPMTFGGSQHIAELSERIEFLANELCLDLHHNYRDNPGFKVAYREAYEFSTAAKFIHNREHQGDRDAIRATVTRIDGLFHDIQNDIVNLERRESRQIGQLSCHARIEELQALIHHLMYDQGVRPSHGPGENGPVGSPVPEEAPPPE